MAEEFKTEATPNLLGGNWRPLPEDESKMIREENNVDGQARLAIILPKAAGKRRFLCWPPQRYKVPTIKEKTTQEILVEV